MLIGIILFVLLAGGFIYFLSKEEKITYKQEAENLLAKAKVDAEKDAVIVKTDAEKVVVKVETVAKDVEADIKKVI